MYSIGTSASVGGGKGRGLNESIGESGEREGLRGEGEGNG